MSPRGQALFGSRCVTGAGYGMPDLIRLGGYRTLTRIVTPGPPGPPGPTHPHLPRCPAPAASPTGNGDATELLVVPCLSGSERVDEIISSCMDPTETDSIGAHS